MMSLTKKTTTKNNIFYRKWCFQAVVGSMKPFSSDQQAVFMAQNFLLVFYLDTLSMYKDLECCPLNIYPKVKWELVKHRTNAPYSLWPAGGLRGGLGTHTDPEVLLPTSAAGQKIKIATNLQHHVLFFIKSSFSSALRKSNAALNPISRH